MNELELKIKESLNEKIPALSKERREKLGQIMELTALVASVYEQVAQEKQQPAAEVDA